MLPGLLFAPIPLLVIVVVFVGFVAATTWLWWCVVWPVFWIFTKLGLSETHYFHLFLATCLGVINLVLLSIFPHI
ncbi:hypothetical protein, partial [Bathymodiolus platifrons methanotrophic gill symbiont]